MTRSRREVASLALWTLIATLSAILPAVAASAR